MVDNRKSGLVALGIWGTLLMVQAGCGDSKKKEVTSLKQNDETLMSSQVEVRPVSNTEPISVNHVVSAKSFEEGERAYGEKKYDEATQIFTNYTVEKPKNAWGYYMLGLSAWKSKNFEQAETAFLKAIELDPSHVKSRLNLGRVYLDKGEPDKAVEQVEQVLTIDSNSAEGYRLLGRGRDELGLLLEAETAYRQAIRLDTTDVWSMNNLALNVIKQHRPEEALGVLARVVELKPDNTLFQNNLGMALELNGYFVKATEAYGKAVELDGNSQKAIDNLARVTGHPDKTGVTELKLDELAHNFVGEIQGPQVSTN